MITAMTLGAELLHARARPVRPLQGVMEPNGKKTAELCVAANYTQRFGSSGANGNAWGYMDSSCTNKFIFMCRIMRGWRGLCVLSCLCWSCPERHRPPKAAGPARTGAPALCWC